MWIIALAIVIGSIIVGGSIESTAKGSKLAKDELDIANSMSLRLMVPVSVDRKEECMNCHELFYFVNANTRLYVRVTNDNYEHLKEVLYKQLHISLGTKEDYRRQD